MRERIIIIMLFMPLYANGQGLFESAGRSPSGSGGGIELNGYTRGTFYLGEYTESLSSEIRSGYGEAALKIGASGSEQVKFFTEIRIRKGYEYNEWVTGMDLREAYADLVLGDFDLRVGQQVIAWGRADGINPTDNITPRDYFVRSPDPDDMRMGNFMLRGRYNLFDRIRLEGIWVPVFRYSVYRFDLFNTSDYVSFAGSDLPAAAIRNGSLAGRIEFFLDCLDGSLSWFSGYDPMPGIRAGELPESPSEDLLINLYSSAFRQQTLGLDFSCSMGSFGVRGEAALRIPRPAYREQVFAPEKDLRYVLGVDRAFGDLNVIVMYFGQYVFDFTGTTVSGGIPEIDPLQLQDPAVWSMLGVLLDEQLAGFNSVMFSQTEGMSHTVIMHPELSLFHGIAEAGISGSYNFSTREWNVGPGFEWQVTDGMKLSIGGQYFEGPANSMYDLAGSVFNGGYMEMRYTF